MIVGSAPHPIHTLSTSRPGSGMLVEVKSGWSSTATDVADSFIRREAHLKAGLYHARRPGIGVQADVQGAFGEYLFLLRGRRLLLRPRRAQDVRHAVVPLVALVGLERL